MPSKGGPRTRSALAERALALAAELGLPRPARALGVRGLARASLGDPGGLRGLPRGDRARDRGRAGSRGGPAPQQPGSGALGASKVPRRPWRSFVRGSPTRRPGGSPRCSTSLTAEHARRSSSIRVSTTRRSSSPPRSPRAWRRAGTCSTSPGSVPRRLGSSPCGVRAARGGRVARLARVRPPGRLEDPELIVSGLGSAALVPRRARPGRGRGGAARRARGLPRLPATTAYYPALLPAMVRTALGIGEPALAERLVSGLEPRYPLRRARPRRGERRPHRGPRGPAGGRRCLRRCRRSLGAVRGRPRAGVRAPRPGPVSGRTLPTDRGRTRPAARPRDLRAAPGGPRARRDRRAPATGDRAQFIGRSWSTPGQGADRTQRYSPVLL